MRILWLMTRYWPAVGGAETHSRQIIQKLAERGHEISVVTHWDENRSDWLRGTTVAAPGVTRVYADGEAARVTRLGYGPWRRLRATLPAATYYLRQRGAARDLARMLETDIIRACGSAWDIVHGVRIGREPLYLAGRSLAQRVGAPFVFTPLHHPRWEGWRYRVYLDLYRDANTLIALTESEARQYEALGVPRERIGLHGIGPVLPPSASGERFRAAHGVGGPLVLFLGQKYPYKGWERLLGIAPRIWRRWPDVTFAFLGPRTTASRRAFASIHDRRVIELDAVDLQTKGDALAACDIFCLPSEQESFGGVYTEAWAYSKPVIGCAIPPVRDVITDGVDGLLIAPGSEDELAQGLQWMLERPERRAAMGRAGQAKVERDYSWTRITEALERVYQKALARQAAPTGVVPATDATRPR
ncbi:MAG TPA: glycosyltransferase family 4 protein [Ktedonobacterales bacterium]|nr:glycosyltransferase family 4 protein [Ktedonobacterales bacterium]